MVRSKAVAPHTFMAIEVDFAAVDVARKHGAKLTYLPFIARAVVDAIAEYPHLNAGVDAGGTFTISNPGPYGMLMTAAIINQPQVAILATDAVRPRPVAVPYPDGSYGVIVHPVGNLGLSFDHRAIDGGYAARFLRKVKRILEERAWLTEL